MTCKACKRPIDEKNCIELVKHSSNEVFIKEKKYFCNENCLAFEMLKYMELKGME